MYFKMLFPNPSPFRNQGIVFYFSQCLFTYFFYYIFSLFITQWQFPVIPFFKFCDNSIAHATSSDSLNSLYDESIGVKNWTGQ